LNFSSSASLQYTTMTALVVLSLHLLLGVGIVLSPPSRGTSGASKPLAFLTELPPPLSSPSTHAIDLHLSIPDASMAVRSPPHPMPMPVPVPASSPDMDGVIVEAAQSDAAQVARICHAWHRQRWREDDAHPAASVLVRVEESGRVSDTRLIVGSGSPDQDEALQHCLLTLARLTPRQLDGQAIAAWQRLDPPAAEPARRQ